MTDPQSKFTNVPAGVPTLPPVMPLQPTGGVRPLAHNAQLALDARMGRPTSIRAIGLSTYRETLASTAEAVPQNRTSGAR